MAKQANRHDAEMLAQLGMCIFPHIATLEINLEGQFRVAFRGAKLYCAAPDADLTNAAEIKTVWYDNPLVAIDMFVKFLKWAIQIAGFIVVQLPDNHQRYVEYRGYLWNNIAKEEAKIRWESEYDGTTSVSLTV